MSNDAVCMMDSAACAPATPIFFPSMFNASLADSGNFDMGELEKSCWSIAQDDEAGQKWCDENNYLGYTSYASLSDLTWRSPFFEELKHLLDLHVKTFVGELDFDLEGRNLKLEDLWINILSEGGNHSAHIHPNSVISGTTYISMPSGSSAIKFEDPRHSMMMAAPSRIKDAKEYLKPFIYVNPSVGDVLLWESWLRHEVPANNSSEERISISFNYSW